MLAGAGFGVTSGVLTSLGLVVGLNAGTDSRAAVAAGVLTVAVADALSDATGMHVSHESKGDGEGSWVAAGMTFAAKLVIALSFLVPVLLLPLGAAVITSVAWGVAILTAWSWYIAGRNGERRSAAIGEHLLIAAVVLAASQALGLLIHATVGG